MSTRVASASSSTRYVPELYIETRSQRTLLGGCTRVAACCLHTRIPASRAYRNTAHVSIVLA